MSHHSRFDHWLTRAVLLLLQVVQVLFGSDCPDERSDWTKRVSRHEPVFATGTSPDLVHETEFYHTEEVHGESCYRLTILLTHDQIWTDGRSKLLRELLSSMQIIKVFTYEIPFLKRAYISCCGVNKQGWRVSEGRRCLVYAKSLSFEQRIRLWLSAFRSGRFTLPE